MNKRTIFNIIAYLQSLDISDGAKACGLAIVCLFNEWADKTATHKARDTRRVLCAADGLDVTKGGAQWVQGFGLAISTPELAKKVKKDKRTIERNKYIEELERAKFLHVERRKGREGTAYFLSCGEEIDVNKSGQHSAPIKSENAQNKSGQHSAPIKSNKSGQHSAPINAAPLNPLIKEENVCEETREDARNTHTGSVFLKFSKWYGVMLQNVNKYILPQSVTADEFTRTLAHIMRTYETPSEEDTGTLEILQRLLLDINANARWRNKITLSQAVERFAKTDYQNPNKQCKT